MPDFSVFDKLGFDFFNQVFEFLIVGSFEEVGDFGGDEGFVCAFLMPVKTSALEFVIWVKMDFAIWGFDQSQKFWFGR